MFIGIANINLEKHKVFEKEYTIRSGERFLARDGVLYSDIKARNVSILKARVERETDKYLETEYIAVEDERNADLIDLELNGHSQVSYEKLKEENKALKEKVKEVKKNGKRK